MKVRIESSLAGMQMHRHCSKANKKGDNLYAAGMQYTRKKVAGLCPADKPELMPAYNNYDDVKTL